jgi:AhpD family alkylhydroperoxidase
MMKHNPEPRVSLTEPAYGGIIQAMYGMEDPLQKFGLDPMLRELVKVRASQINGCAYCIDMHTKDARARGETEQRLYGLSAWRETPYYTDRERAALEFTEHLTLIAGKDVPDALYARMKEQFTDQEMIHLAFAIVQINAWNRMVITVKVPVGTYQAQKAGSAQRSQ